MPLMEKDTKGNLHPTTLEEGDTLIITLSRGIARLYRGDPIVKIDGTVMGGQSLYWMSHTGERDQTFRIQSDAISSSQAKMLKATLRLMAESHQFNIIFLRLRTHDVIAAVFLPFYIQ